MSIQHQNSLTDNIPRGIHVVGKPIGPVCNLNREYKEIP